MRICLVGPSHPFRGGIAHYTTLLATHIREATEHDLLLISLYQQYPRWLFPGSDDRDPSQNPLQTPAEYLLSPLNPLSWLRTWRRMREWQPDLVVFPWWVPFWAPVWGSLGRATRRLSPRPRLIFICHNVMPHEAGLFDGVAARWALAPADGYVAHSRADAAHLQRLFPGRPVRVNPHPTYGPLLQQKATDAPLALPDERPLLLFCGFVRPYKGLDVLLESLPVVLSRRRVHLLVAGEFWDGEKKYLRQIERLGIGRAVTMRNAYIPDGELAAYLQAADAVVLPYKHATQSGVIQLAFGQNRPVITTNVGGLAEVVDHEQTGLVVPPQDPQALAEAIDRFFAEELGPEFSANIRRQEERFSWGRLVEQLVVLAQVP